MVRLRRNHDRSKAFGMRMLLWVIVASVAIMLIISRLSTGIQSTLEKIPLDQLLTEEDARWYLPNSTTDQVIHHDHYSLSYSEEHEQAEWVAYKLTKSSLIIPNVPRTDWFEKDPAVLTGSAEYKDYSGSGFTRGHLAPAGDMAFNESAMMESFFMSNVSPQKRPFNNGIWKELEEQVRDWAFQFDELYVITGPVLAGSSFQRIGRNQVAVPEYFYKIILSSSEPDPRAIAFLIPNELSDKKMANYMVTVDSIEALTNIDFFHQLLDHEQEIELESTVSAENWLFSESRYLQRIEKWNKQ